MTSPQILYLNWRFLLVLLSVLSVSTGTLVHFKPGYKYEYQYEANVTLDQVDTIKVTAKVYIRNTGETNDTQELQLEVENFKFHSSKHGATTNNHRPDFSKWFSFLMTTQGEVMGIFHPSNEDVEILVAKKSITGLLAGKFVDTNNQEAYDSQYIADELGPEGPHSSVYRVVPKFNGKTFSKTRVIDVHPMKHAQSHLQRTTYIDSDLGTIHSVHATENVTANHVTKPGFDPYYAMRKTDAVNEFEQVSYPDLKAYSTGTLRFIDRHFDDMKVERPAGIKVEPLHASNEIQSYRKSRLMGKISVAQVNDYIRTNLTCMTQNAEEGRPEPLVCFNNIIDIMKGMSTKQLRKVIQSYLNLSDTTKTRATADQNAILDALCSVGTNASQDLLAKFVLERSPPNEALMQRALVHIATMQEVPNQNILAFLEKALFDVSDFQQKYSLTTYRRVLLAAGSVINKLTKHGFNDKASRLTERLHQLLDFHDPWKFRLKRSTMTEAEHYDYDMHHVILLEALGNGCQDDSYEYILSHVNDTNSPWIKRAGIHALRKYHHTHAAGVMLDLALNDENEEVRYEAMLQYRSHPHAEHAEILQQIHGRSNESKTVERKASDISTKTEAKLSRHKRGIFDKKWKFNLEAPSVDWQKRTGSTDIGASFGVIMINYLKLQIAPLSGFVRVRVHDEVYARVHLGFLGFNLDFFSARLCFKGETSYDLNILQEHDPRLNAETFELVEKSLHDISDGIRKGINLLTSLIEGDGQLSFKRIIDEFLGAFRDIPNKIKDLRKTAVDIANEVGDLIEEELPAFLKPAKDVIQYANDLMSKIKSDFMDFYNSMVQMVETTIPNAATTIFKSAEGIIKAFPQLFKDPKTAVANIGKGVIRIALTVKQLRNIKKTVQDAVEQKVMTHLRNMDDEYEKLSQMVREAFDALVNKGKLWVQEVITDDDPIAVVTNGKMTSADIRRRVLIKLEAITEDLFAPFADLRNVVQGYSDKFSQLFTIISDIKEAVNGLKNGYKQARTAIESIFGPKCHTDFPRVFRVSGVYCPGDGFYPSKLGGPNIEYVHPGIDILIESGQTVVAPFSGTAIRTKSNEVKLTDIADLVTGTEIFITNIIPKDDIYEKSDEYFVGKQVAAGDELGTAMSSGCENSNNHIHFAMTRNSEPIDPSRFLRFRRPEKPSWKQECDEYKVVYKFETVDAGAIVGIGGRKEEDTSKNLPDDETRPDSISKDAEPTIEKSNAIIDKVNSRRRKRGIIDTAKTMIDVLVDKTEAFLEHLSISRITLGNIVSFIELLGLEETKTKLAETLKTIQRAVNSKPCKAPDAMTNDELQLQLLARGLSSSGERQEMIKTLTTGDKRCPVLSFGMPEYGRMMCVFDSDCLGVDCCVNFRFSKLLIKSYRAYAKVNVKNWTLTISMEDWKKSWRLEDKEVIEETVPTGLRFDLLDMEIICRYKIELGIEEILVTFAAGVCADEDDENCVVNVKIFDEARFPLPKVMEDGSIEIPTADWNNYFSKETVKNKLQETGQAIIGQVTDAVIDEFLDELGIPKEYLKDNPRCPIPENLADTELHDALEKKDLSTEGSRDELEQRLTTADMSCVLVSGRELSLPGIENEALRKYFYYTISKHCMRIEACLDVSIDALYYKKTFTAAIELDPCNFQLTAEFENWNETKILIEYEWGKEEKLILSDTVYLRYSLKNLSKDFELDAELVVEEFAFNSRIIKDLKIPKPLCSENFRLPGRGDWLSLALSIGRTLTNDTFRTFLSYLKIDNVIIDGTCPTVPESADCKRDINDYLPDALKSVLHCAMIDNCWGIQCCANFTFDLPLLESPILMHMPIMFRFDPCEYVFERTIGTRGHNESLFKSYSWGQQKQETFGRGDEVKLSYSVDKKDDEFILDAELSICLPLDGDEKFCVPVEGTIKLINNVHIPACLNELVEYDGLKDFSLADWLHQQGKVIGDELETATKDFLLQKFGLKERICDRKVYPFSPLVDGWNIACDKSLVNKPTLPDFMACHVDETCSKIICCVDIDAIKTSVKVQLDVDLCQNSITAGFDDAVTKIEGALSEYKWGKEQTLQLGRVLTLTYNIEKSGREVYIITAHIAACFEWLGFVKLKCAVDNYIFSKMEIPKRICTSTSETCMPLVQNLKHQCGMDSDCSGITCEVETDIDTPLLVSVRADKCSSNLVLRVDQTSWTESISSVTGKDQSKGIAQDLTLQYTIKETTTDYQATITLKICGKYFKDGSCRDIVVLSDFSLKKGSCTQASKRRKREYVTIYETSEFNDELRTLIQQKASNRDIEQLRQEIIDANTNVRFSNMESFGIDPSDAATTILSNVKALGTNNPAVIPFLDEDYKDGVSLEVTGAKAVIDLLENVTDIFDDAKKTYVIGEGLTRTGVQQLGGKLASMTIGDLEAFLDLSNLDAVEVHQIITDLIDLATVLYSETIDAIATGEIGNAFESFEITLRGCYKYPPITATFFKYPATFFLGPVTVDFVVGAGCVYGVDTGVGLKIMSMTAEASAVPYAGVWAYGELGICFGPFCASLHLTGYILNMKMPTTAEIGFSRFPLSVGLRMDLYLVPLRLTLKGKVKFKIRIPFCCSISKTLWSKNIWSWSSPLLEKSPMLDLKTKEKDPDPPEFTSVSRTKRDTTQLLQHCEVSQVPGLDYTEPAFQIAVSVEDSLSMVWLYLDVGTFPGGNDVLSQERLGGSVTKLSKILTPTGVPLHFTMYAENSQGSRSSVTCQLKTYDITLPTGRFDADFKTTSNAHVLKASVVVHDDSPIIESVVGIGYGKGVYGDQVKKYTTVVLDERQSMAELDNKTDDETILGHFTGMKNGRLIGERTSSVTKVGSVGECAKRCLQLPEYDCLSFNYDYRKSELCEIMRSIQGADYSLAKDGLFSHYERLGTGYAFGFAEKELQLQHNALYIFNLDMTNSLGYRRIISTEGTLVDLTPPEPGLIRNAKQDIFETTPCLDLIPDDRFDWQKYCIGVDASAKNHRLIIDGEGSRTLFNGRDYHTDMKYTRINNYITANWDGFTEKETSILGYTFAFGKTICGHEIQNFRDPHIHFLSSDQWDYKIQVYPIPSPYEKLPDGRYFISVRALNSVEYGGPLATTVCHSTPYTVDTSPPIINEIYGLRYDEMSFSLRGKLNIIDPHSGIAEYDICFGGTSRTCDLQSWFKYDYEETRGNIEHTFKLPDGMPAWIRIKAINGVYLSTVGVVDQPLLVESTGPIAGFVFDGPTMEQDEQYTKTTDKLCFNWINFNDPESGIAHYLVGAGTEPGLTDVIRLTEISHGQTSVCLNVAESLEHGTSYYGIVWAFNGAVNQKNNSAVSNGLTIDTTPPEAGFVVDGGLDSFKDVDFSSTQSTVEVQWDRFNDPESGIEEYDIKIMKEGQTDWEMLKDWTTVSKSETKASWNNFHHQHKDFIRSSLRVTNGAANKIVVDTNGVLIDLTAPVIDFLVDGRVEGIDQVFQSDDSEVSCTFNAYDLESGLEYYKFQVYEKLNGQKRKIWPENDGWEEYQGMTKKTSYQRDGLQLSTGAIYSVRLAVENSAGLHAIHETDGVKLDLTKPDIRWFHVGVFYGESEDIHDGYVYQTDHNGIKVSFLIIDPESGVSKLQLRVGTHPGGDEIMKLSEYSGTERDIYLSDLILEDTDVSLQNIAPVYYVTLVAFNGAGSHGEEYVSTPIAILPEDVAGIVFDGITDAQGTNDVEYTVDSAVVSSTFTGFKSTIHGISSYVWSVGSRPGIQDILPFTEDGLNLPDNQIGNGGVESGLGFSQMPLYLKHGETYFTTIRAITHGGNVLESASNGFIVDQTPGKIQFERVSTKVDKETEDMSPTFIKDVQDVAFEWSYFDEEYKSDGVLDNINSTWYAIGTIPFGDDITSLTEVPVSSTYGSRLDANDVNMPADGLPFVLGVYIRNSAGQTTVKRAPAVVFDSSEPNEGNINCPKYVQAQGEFQCGWTPFFDRECPLSSYVFSLGTDAGKEDLVANTTVPANTTWFEVDSSKLPLNGAQSMFATLKAVNRVGLETYKFSDEILIDTTPPIPGVVIELSKKLVYDSNGNSITENITCQTATDCLEKDAVCQESLVSVDVAWQPFTDEESGIAKYQLALGYTEGGTEIQDFADIFPVKEHLTHTVTGLNLYGARQVFATVKAINGAGMSAVSLSNGIFLSYISQDLDALSPIGVWDADPGFVGDINYQTDKSTIRAAWDVTGDPCPVTSYEWAIERLDGKVIQDFISVTEEIQANDQLQLLRGETYYSLLRVTNALGYQYILRSDGVTINDEPLIPGSVFDGDVLGYDLAVIHSSDSVACNWEGFGIAKLETIDNVLTGNKGSTRTEVPENQEVSHYEVGLGRDRRFQNTKDDVAAFRNVGKHTAYTFTNLNLTSGSAIYYCTVKAYADALSTATVTSNGFSVKFIGGVTASEIIIPRYITSDSEMSIQWKDFRSSVNMLLYYVAVADNDNASVTSCNEYVDAWNSEGIETVQLFTIRQLKYVALNTHVKLQLRLQHGQTYYIYVIGTDMSGECNMSKAVTTVDITPPVQGSITAGPYYDMKQAYTNDSRSISVKWKDFDDLDSGVEGYVLSVFRVKSCWELMATEQIGESVKIAHTILDYKIRDIKISENATYIVKITCQNNAGLKVESQTSPVVFDDSIPLAGTVVEGTDFKGDIVWMGNTTSVEGTFLHLPSNTDDACPSRAIPFSTDSGWTVFNVSSFQQHNGENWKIKYVPYKVEFNTETDSLELRMSQDYKYDQMLSGAVYRSADMLGEGTYQIQIKAAKGNGIAVTEVMFLDAEIEDYQTYNYEEDPELADNVCSCCLESLLEHECLCLDCAAYLDGLHESASESQTVAESSTITTPVSSTTESDADENMGLEQAFTIKKQKGCGLQIISGTTPFLVVWCRFFNGTGQDMEIRSDLQFDPSEDFHTYKMFFDVAKEDSTESFELEISVDDRRIQKLSGIPELSSSTKFFLHIWNKDNYIPERLDIFDHWAVNAEFKSLIFPTGLEELCRFGNVFQGGSNPIVRYEAGIGSQIGSTDIYPFQEILRPCIPCEGACSALHCDPLCEATTVQLSFILDDIQLPAIREAGNETELLTYHLAVKAVLGSGAYATAYSNGFSVDTTPPVFDKEVFAYIDVYQSDFTPVEFQGCSHTIKSIWLCTDNESGIKNYTWAIGSVVGGTDIQDFKSTGSSPLGINSDLEGILKDQSRYYISILCTNAAGFSTLFEDTRGVEVLLEAPAVETIVAETVDAESFENDVIPTDAKKSVVHDSLGVLWEAADDPAVSEYDFCIGSSETKIDDIFPCLMVGHNQSGSVEIRDGYLMYAGQKMYSLREIAKKVANGSDEEPGVFYMETGRILFPSLRICNEALRCDKKSLGTITIMSETSQIQTAVNGSSLVFTVNNGIAKRDIYSAGEIIVETPDDLHAGQSMIVSLLTDEELQLDYRSDASEAFVSFISNPNGSADSLERLLSGRIQSFGTSFSVISVGQLQMTGPLKVSFTQSGDTHLEDNEYLTMLIHWNPDLQLWQISSRTCRNENDTVIEDFETHMTTVKVCDTRNASSGSYFYAETHFCVVVAKLSPVNYPPRLKEIPLLSMKEDGGTLEVQLTAIDPDGDEVEFYLLSTASDFPDLADEMTLGKTGLFTFTPCITCFGTANQIEILLIDKPTETELESFSTTVYISVQVYPVNNAPVIFMVDTARNYMLSEDPTEEITIFLENRMEVQEKFSAYVGAYDYDPTDRLSLLERTASNGSFLLIDLEPDVNKQQYFDCSTSLCLNAVPVVDSSKLVWTLSRIDYTQETNFTGIDTIHVIFQDREGTSSDRITLSIVLLEMPCLHGGECLAISHESYTCTDKRRISNFFHNYVCVCPSGWVGSRCEEDVNECDMNICQSPFIACTNLPGSYECQLATFVIVLIVLSVVLSLALPLLYRYRQKICFWRSKKDDKTDEGKIVGIVGKTHHPKHQGDGLQPTLPNVPDNVDPDLGFQHPPPADYFPRPPVHHSVPFTLDVPRKKTNAANLSINQPKLIQKIISGSPFSFKPSSTHLRPTSVNEDNETIPPFGTFTGPLKRLDPKTLSAVHDKGMEMNTCVPRTSIPPSRKSSAGDRREAWTDTTASDQKTSSMKRSATTSDIQIEMQSNSPGPGKTLASAGSSSNLSRVSTRSIPDMLYPTEEEDLVFRRVPKSGWTISYDSEEETNA